MSAHNIEYKRFLAEALIEDPGNTKTIRPTTNGTCNLVSLAAETRTVADPDKVGQELWLVHMTDGGDITVTFSTAYTEDGATTVVFSDPGQFLFVKAVRTSATTLAWRKVSDSGIGNLTLAETAVLDDLGGLTATADEINARAAAASRIVNVTDAATYSVLAANSGKIHIIPDLTASCTLTLPTAAAGLEYTFIGKGVAADAQDWIIKSPSATNFYLGGVSFADTDAGAGADEIHAGIYSNGSSNDFLTVVTPGAGTRIYMICDGTNWIVNGQVFSATVPAFSDT